MVDYGRNVIHLSCYDWAGRTGPDKGIFSHTYEILAVHEYEHLLNHKQKPFQELFLNEGCAEYCGILLGYGMNKAKISAFLNMPDNSLTMWYDQTDWPVLADYGAAGCYVTYLADHFGPEIVRHLVVTDHYGPDAVNAAFKALGFNDWTFDKAFRYWSLANLIHSDDPGKGWYNYKSIDLNDPMIGSLRTLNYNSKDGWVASSASRYGNSILSDGYETRVSLLGPYSTDYIQVTNGGRSWSSGLRSEQLRLYFDGDQINRGWQRSGTGILPSGWAVASEGETSVPWRVSTGDIPFYGPDFKRTNDFYAMLNTYYKEPSSPPLVADEWLIMETGFDTMGVEGLNLSFEYQLYYGWPPPTCGVFISIDGGDNYIEAYNITESGRTMDRIEVPIDWASNCRDVRLAIRCIDTADAPGSGTWLYINNVVLTDEKERAVFSEDFDHYVIDHWWSDSTDNMDCSLVGEA